MQVHWHEYNEARLLAQVFSCSSEGVNMKQQSKVVSTHLWNTPRATFTNRLCVGIPFIVGERGIAERVCSRGVL